jgi:hypothetical protein
VHLIINETHMKLDLRPWTSAENYTKVASDTMERLESTLESEQLKYSVALQGTP